MDTRFWGPSAWRLLHLIAAAEHGGHGNLKTFFGSLPYVLPCKYCRYSLTDYIDELPITFPLDRWLWQIHNKVNDKLRSQNLHVEPDPPFATVRKLYGQRLGAGCTRTEFEGWEFLFSIVENHPFSRGALTGTPLPNAPDTVHTCKERNRWNMCSPQERFERYKEFWETLPSVLPFPEWKQIWNSCSTDWSDRQTALKTLWGIRCRMEKELQLLNKTTFSSLCKTLRQHRSGCNKAKRAKTCRKKKGGDK
jgi:hypothetical protein